MTVPSSILSASVGLGGTNQRNDVLMVQKLLNAVPIAKGGPAPQLVVDGLCGPKTGGAIQKFQSVNTGFPDGRIDPGKPNLG
jgi:peptidoglycan hydrolase-like protein with peptidoglycan-binding domain